jgi:hypothetical protein
MLLYNAYRFIILQRSWQRNCRKDWHYVSLDNVQRFEQPPGRSRQDKVETNKAKVRQH